MFKLIIFQRLTFLMPSAKMLLLNTHSGVKIFSPYVSSNQGLISFSQWIPHNMNILGRHITLRQHKNLYFPFY